MAYSGSFHMTQRENTAARDNMTPREIAPTPPERGVSASAENRPAERRPAERRPAFDLGALFSKTEIAGMETDDLLMALILYLMYRESGDQDLLIMLGVMLLT